MPSSQESIARAQQLGDEVNGEPENVDAALQELAVLLHGSDDPEVLIAVALALGDAWDERAAALLLPLVGHPDARVREAMTQALPGGVSTAAMRAQVTQALVVLAADPADEVRNWACFGLGQLEVDSVEVRDALLANLDHDDLDTRSEALLALAKLGDPASLTTTLQRLGADPDDVAVLELQAAAELADAALLPALEQLTQVWADDEDEHMQMLGFALRRCRRTAAVQAAALEAELLAGVTSGLETTGISVRLDGSYPRTVLHLLRPDDDEPESYRVWSDEEPGTYDLEQHVMSFLHTAQD